MKLLSSAHNPAAPLASIAVLLVLLAGTARADVCASQMTADACAAVTRAEGNNAGCIWRSERCQVDPCRERGNDRDECLGDARCLWGLDIDGRVRACFSQELLCRILGTADCGRAGVCRVDGSNCVWTLANSPGRAGSLLDPECLNFPVWSIALVIVWLILMAVIIFIIMILKKTKHTDAIRGIEQENEVVVDSLHINDAFQPQATTSYMQPLATNQMR